MNEQECELCGAAYEDGCAECGMPLCADCMDDDGLCPACASDKAREEAEGEA
ncbi:MAG: hypothetical protein IPL28_25585 [Chloroflexi bacterium]|nr:hypothetical protein [Chloroflexota bacterium]